jgi:hypothetical protein
MKEVVLPLKRLEQGRGCTFRMYHSGMKSESTITFGVSAVQPRREGRGLPDLSGASTLSDRRKLHQFCQESSGTPEPWGWHPFTVSSQRDEKRPNLCEIVELVSKQVRVWATPAPLTRLHNAQFVR